MAGLRLLLFSSHLFRTLSHSHMQGKTAVWLLDFGSLIFVSLYRWPGFRALKYWENRILALTIFRSWRFALTIRGIGDLPFSTYEAFLDPLAALVFLYWTKMPLGPINL